MDILGTSEKQSNGLVTITLTLDGPPNRTSATACSRESATGGLWDAEFWSSGSPVGTTAEFPNGNYYIAYRDNTGDGAPRVEAGYVDALSVTLNHNEFDPVEVGTAGGTALGGTCFSTPPPASTCTVLMSAPLAGLGIKPGAGMYSISGFSTYYFGTATTIPGTRVPLGNTNLADIATPFDDNGTGTTQ